MVSLSQMFVSVRTFDIFNISLVYLSWYQNKVSPFTYLWLVSIVLFPCLYKLNLSKLPHLPGIVFSQAGSPETEAKLMVAKRVSGSRKRMRMLLMVVSATTHEQQSSKSCLIEIVFQF